uniref:tetratricopeptide repeat protein n=1 Tax=Psychrobacter sp. CAL346-MNA-CIBAN-0220 TaxID=3140457 RepID=UPI0033282F90
NLGLMYFQGLGVRQEYAKAVEWFEKAGNQGNVEAQYNLGVMYANGIGVHQDENLAVELFQNACDKGLQKGCDGYRLLN